MRGSHNTAAAGPFGVTQIFPLGHEFKNAWLILVRGSRNAHFFY